MLDIFAKFVQESAPQALFEATAETQQRLFNKKQRQAGFE